MIIKVGDILKFGIDQDEFTPKTFEYIQIVKVTETSITIKSLQKNDIVFGTFESLTPEELAKYIARKINK